MKTDKAGKSVANAEALERLASSGNEFAENVVRARDLTKTLTSHIGHIRQHSVQARLSRDLVTLKDDVPVEVPVDMLGVRDPEADALLGFLREMEFATLTKRIAEGLKVDVPPPVDRPAAAPAEETASASASATFPKAGGKPQPAAGATTPQAAVATAQRDAKQKIDRSQYATVTELPQLEAWIAEARAAGRLAFDLETTSLDAMQAEFVGFSLAVAPGKACYVPLGHRPASDAFDFGELTGEANRGARCARAPQAAAGGPFDPQDRPEPQVRPPRARPARHRSRPARRHHAALLRARRWARPARPRRRLPSATSGTPACRSTQVLEHAPGAKKSDKTFAQVPLDKATEYAAEDADVTLRLWMVLKPRLAAEHMATVYETLERPMVPVLGDMERAGIRVDKSILSRLTSTFAQRIARLEEEIYDLAGHKFNLGSPKQLGEFLFDSLKLPGGRKTKTGQWETRANLLDDLAAREDLPEDARKLINVMLEWRQLTKLRSTYTDSLPATREPGNGTHSHLLCARLHHHGAPRLHRPQPAEHSNSHQGGP